MLAFIKKAAEKLDRHGEPRGGRRVVWYDNAGNRRVSSQAEYVEYLSEETYIK